MAETQPEPVQIKQPRIPFWRDIRVLGVLAQIAFLTAVIIGLAWILSNVAQNLVKLGENQFLCRDGTSNIRCAFDFLSLDASFEISEKLIPYDPSNSYAQALLVGLLNTVQVTVIGIIFSTILGTFAGIAQLSNNWLLATIAKWYVDLMRNTPLLLILFFLFFGVLLVLPPIREAIQPLGMPVYLSQRGINLPALVTMPSFSTWLIFLLGGLLLAVILWLVLGRLETRRGKSFNRALWATLAFLIGAVIGWFITSATADSQGILAAQDLGVSQFDDLEGVMLSRLPVEDLGDLDAAVADGQISAEAIADAALIVCAVKESPSEVNLTAQLRSANIPYTVERFNEGNEASEAFAAGECELYVANKVDLVTGADYPIIQLREAPIRMELPQIEGLNFVGGMKMTPSFAAILIGLIIYTGAFIAEIVRAGIQSVSKGQSEAARSLGLSESQRLRLVVLPQALRVIIPPLTSQYLNLAKNSSLAIAVGFADLWAVAFTTLNQSGRAVQVFLLVMAFYLGLSLIISFILNWYNRRIALVER